MEARNRQLPEWFNRVRTGQTRLPRFQRFEAWSHNEICSCLEAVLRGLPVGATLILEIGDKEPFKSRTMVGTPKPVERVTEHLLDGQQRLTALWRSFHDDYEDRTYFVFFDDDDEIDGAETPRVFGQARWCRNGQRYPLWADDAKEINKRGYIPLRLLRPGDIAEEIDDWCDEAVGRDTKLSRALGRKIQNLRTTVATYNIPFLSLPPTTQKAVALDVFIKLNTSSVRLTAFDIVVAQVEEETGRSLHDLVTELKSRAPMVDGYTSPPDLVLSVAAMREDKPPTQASYQRLELSRLVTNWDRLIDGIAFAISFLEQERVFDGDRLPTSAVLPVLAAVNDDMPKSLDSRGNAKTLLRKYLWRSFLTRRYENSAATYSLQDLRGLRAVLSHGQPESAVPLFDEFKYPLPSRELVAIEAVTALNSC